MKFALKYWRHMFRTLFKPSILSVLNIVGILIFALIISIDAFAEYGFAWESALTFFAGMIIGCLGYCVFLAIFVAVIIQHKRRYYEILDQKGYCMEAFNYYQQTYILGKPVNENDYIEFAELYQKFGDYDSAIRVLDSIRVPESNRTLRVLYLFEYMTIAVAKNDAALADDIWRLNHGFINSVISDPKSGVAANGLYLVMIYADCLAGRYERAFQICKDFLDSTHIKKYKVYKENFLVMKIYLLKKLDRDSEINSAVMEFNDYVVNEWKPLLEISRTELRSDVEKAMRGEIPI